MGPAGPAGTVSASYELKTASVTNSNNTKTLTVDCPVGKKAVGGGGAPNVLNGDVVLIENRPADVDTWLVTAAEDNNFSGNWTLTVYATCVA